MKTLQIIIFFLIGIYSNAQNKIVDIIDDDGSAITNTYYKDVNNLLNSYEGTYIYTNGNTSFKIVLIKKTQQYNGRYYEDLIIGEYHYIENGIEIVNTLSELNTTYSNQRIHNIDGNTIVDKNYRVWPCPDCGINENRLRTSIRDASTNRYAKLIMRRTIINSQDVLQIKIGHISGVPYLVGEPEPANFSLPIGEFTLIKQ